MNKISNIITYVFICVLCDCQSFGEESKFNDTSDCWIRCDSEERLRVIHSTNAIVGQERSSPWPVTSLMSNNIQHNHDKWNKQYF